MIAETIKGLISKFGRQPGRSPAATPEGMRIYAVGDIHGCARLLDQLTDKIIEVTCLEGRKRLDYPQSTRSPIVKPQNCARKYMSTFSVFVLVGFTIGFVGHWMRMSAGLREWLTKYKVDEEGLFQMRRLQAGVSFIYGLGGTLAGIIAWSLWQLIERYSN